MKSWGVTRGEGRLHDSQVICTDCGLVFSNPVCEWPELESFYSDHFWEDHWPGALSLDSSLVQAAIEERRPEVRLMKKYAAAGRLLDVGSGTGTFLAAASSEGFDDVWGIETSPVAVAHSREAFGLKNVLQGSMPDERLGASTFDVIFVWHVIEHVLDLDEFVGSLRSILRPGGLLWVGTENYRNASHYLDRASLRIRGRPAPFATASEHTMVFDRRTLRDALERRGFDVLMCEAYQPALVEKLKLMKFRSPFSRLYFELQHAANLIANTGPLMRLAARKR